MFYPFLVTDPYSGLHYRLNDSRLAELSLCPQPSEWAPSRAISSAPDPVWAESYFNAPAETVAAVSSALEDLISSTSTLRPPQIASMADSRAKRHLSALVQLWRQLQDCLPEGLVPVRHVLEQQQGSFLDPLPVVDGSLDPLAPACMKALYERLQTEFGLVTVPPRERKAPRGSRLFALQGGIGARELETGATDGSVAFFGLRDPASCADFAAARARALIEDGVAARDIAVMTADETRQLVRAFAAQGVPLSGHPADLPERDFLGETALNLLLAKRPPTPAMVLASLILSPLMPWELQTGRDLAESVMAGDFRGRILDANSNHKALWQDIRTAASSLQHLRFLIDRICERLPQGKALLARLPIPAGEGSPDWETILRAVQIAPPSEVEQLRNLEGVSLWSARESPWRPCRHLIVTDFTEGLYPARPHANPLFLDSEILEIRAAIGLQLHGRAEELAHSLALFDEQLQSVSESVTFLIPWRDLSGVRIAPSAGLSLIARATSGIGEAGDLVTDLSRQSLEFWPVSHHRLARLPDPLPLPEALVFPDRDLLGLRRDDNGTAMPQSPSRLETLIVSPLAWLLGEINATDLAWTADELDVLAKGNIAHDVFEHVFPAGEDVLDPKGLEEAVSKAYEQALTHHAGFLRNSSWEMERKGLEREILIAAQRWRDHILALSAKIRGSEIWLAGESNGILVRGKADMILELPTGELLVVDHKKSGTSGRRRRMEAGWDLQAGLYRDMLARPSRREGDDMQKLIGRKIAIAYHLMNDGGFLTSGLVLPQGSTARDMGNAVNEGAVNRLIERLGELGSGQIVLNGPGDETFYRKEGGFTPYALSDGSPLVRAFIRQAEEQ